MRIRLSGLMQILDTNGKRVFHSLIINILMVLNIIQPLMKKDLGFLGQKLELL